MSTAAKDHITDLERHRLRLQDQVTQLRNSLKHWQTWDAEYEGLKEEIQGFKGGDPSAQDMIQMGRDFGGELVNEKEIKELLGKDLQRSAKQVADLISRRQDYVQKNVQTVQKQVDAAEDKLNKVLIVSSPSVQDEDGGPLMDIREELDEEGNVLSRSVSRPEQHAPKIVGVLRKAGIIDLQEDQADSSPQKNVDSETKWEATSTPSEPSTAPKVTSAESEISQAATRKPVDNAPKKSVSFTADTKIGAELEQSGTKVPISSYARFKPGSRVVELDENDNVVGAEIAGIKNPVIPEDESPEDARLRREMLEYGLNEVGSVVAELDLYEGDSQESDWDEEMDEDSDIEEIEEEDEWGRSTRPAVTEDYRQKMLELEQKLNARMLENVGPQPEDANLNTMLQQAQGVHRLVVKTDEEIPPALLPKQNNSKAPPGNKTEKGVRSAESLDISPAPHPAPPTEGETSNAAPKPSDNPIADAIVERAARATASVPAPTPEPAPARKVSRFKSARASASAASPIAPPAPATLPVREVPTGPPDRPLASSIVERDAPASAVSGPDPDGTDPAQLEQEVKTEYHKLRNKMIHRQGGFKASPEEEAEPLMEERDGKVKKVSRFRAARLGLGGAEG